MIFSNTFCQLFGINNPKWKIWVQKLFITYWKICYKRLFITYFPICYKRFILHDRLFIRYWKILYKRSEKIVKYLISWLGAEPYFLFWIGKLQSYMLIQPIFLLRSLEWINTIQTPN